jgi:hypothetical protein
MDISELKEAFNTGAPITYRDTEYTCISALIYRKTSGSIIVQAELADRNGNSVVIASPNRIEKART